jgi:proteic killer suppression protein
MPSMAIPSFASPAVERFFREGRRLKGVGRANVARVAARKLDMLDYAAALTDLASPPGDRLEALRGNLTGFPSIRINDQWRVVFRWTDAGAAEVDICDYH